MQTLDSWTCVYKSNRFLLGKYLFIPLWEAKRHLFMSIMDKYHLLFTFNAYFHEIYLCPHCNAAIDWKKHMPYRLRSMLEQFWMPLLGLSMYVDWNLWTWCGIRQGLSAFITFLNQPTSFFSSIMSKQMARTFRSSCWGSVTNVLTSTD